MIYNIQIERYNNDVALLHRKNTPDCYCDCLKGIREVTGFGIATLFDNNMFNLAYAFRRTNITPTGHIMTGSRVIKSEHNQPLAYNIAK